jgi:hypothetical protein
LVKETKLFMFSCGCIVGFEYSTVTVYNREASISFITAYSFAFHSDHLLQNCAYSCEVICNAVTVRVNLRLELQVFRVRIRLFITTLSRFTPDIIGVNYVFNNPQVSCAKNISNVSLSVFYVLKLPSVSIKEYIKIEFGYKIQIVEFNGTISRTASVYWTKHASHFVRQRHTHIAAHRKKKPPVSFCVSCSVHTERFIMQISLWTPAAF